MGQKKKLVYYLVPVLGVLFGLWYIKAATDDVVYSDYIRIINSYLPDVWNPEKFFVPDILTRVPVTYLERGLNVMLFGYSTTVEMALGVLFLGAAAALLAVYCLKEQIGFLWFALISLVMFSLNKWEMMTNGTGWVHFFAFACFYYHYLVFDRVWKGQEKKGDWIRMALLPFLISWGAAGQYCAVYLAVLFAGYGFCLLIKRLETGNWNKEYFIWLGCVLGALAGYMISMSFAVEEHAGATGRTFLEVLTDPEKPWFFVKFILKSLASMIFGGEIMEEFLQTGVWSDRICYLLGALVLLGYLAALFANFRYRIYKKTMLPLLLLAGGGVSHMLVLMSRWIFEKESYAWSSRYALQFQMGIFGIILTLALVWQEIRKRGAYLLQIFTLCFCLAILAGNGYTTYKEIKKAPYREDAFVIRASMAADYENQSDEDLADKFQYKKGPEKIRNAFQILKENRWNIYRNLEEER